MAPVVYFVVVLHKNAEVAKIHTPNISYHRTASNSVHCVIYIPIFLRKPVIL